MAYSVERLERMITKLRKKECRVTPQRIAILKILTESRDHPTVEWIHQRVKKDFPTTSLATVYKTVTLAKELGEAMELGFSDGSNRYDGNNPNPHPHLICTQCKKILDPKLETLDHMTQEVAKDTGFRIIAHRLDFFGICPNCQKNE
jgi:Fur family peroxide stress response transcriptional regulator